MTRTRLAALAVALLPLAPAIATARPASAAPSPVAAPASGPVTPGSATSGSTSSSAASIPTATTGIEVRHLQGALADGSTWDIAVPAGWRGDLVLYSHGFRTGPDNPSVDAGFAPTATALEARGYAVAQSSYARTGWALASAVDDQLGVLAQFRAQVGRPRRTIAFGRSMGGLVSSLVAERPRAGVSAAVSTCGLVGGGLDLDNYQLDGAQAVASLLLPGSHVRLTRFGSEAEAAAVAQRLVDAVTAAQATPAGRARIALAATLMDMPRWATGDSPPAPRDAAAIEQAQVSFLTATLPMALTRRVDIEQQAGGDSGYDEGVDYARLLARSAGAGTVAALYRGAGLDLRHDLAAITRDAHVTSDPAAVRWMARTSTPTGRLQVPVLTMHTIADPAAPVEFEHEYRDRVRRAGAGDLLRQSYVQRIGHCAFTPAENVAALQAVQERLDRGRWTSAVTPADLQRVALATDLGDAAFVRYAPGPLVNDRADRDPVGPRARRTR